MSKETDKARAVGFNHIALEVGNVEEALAFYGKIFDFKLRGQGPKMAFIDMGDQFLAITESNSVHRDEERHFGLVVDDKEKVRVAAEAAGADMLPVRSVEFRDPWGNRFQIVQYSEIQFMKTDAVLDYMGLGDLEKAPHTLDELREKGIKAD